MESPYNNILLVFLITMFLVSVVFAIRLYPTSEAGPDVPVVNNQGIDVVELQIGTPSNNMLIDIQRLLKEGGQAFYAADYTTALEKWKQGLELARQVKQHQAIGVFLGNIGNVYRNLSEYPKALEYFEKSFEISRNLDDQVGEGNALGNIGNLYSTIGKFQKALDYYQQALIIKRKLNDLQGESSTIFNLGMIFNNLSQYLKALDYCQQALAINNEIDDPRGKASILSGIGLIYDNLSQHNQALDYHQQALVIHRKINDRYGENTNLTSICPVYLDLNEYHKAIDYCQQALIISREIGDQNSESVNLTNLSAAYERLGQYKKAQQHLKQAKVIKSKIGDLRGKGADVGNEAVKYAKLGQFEKALKLFQKSLLHYHKVGNRHKESDSLTNIGLMYDNLGQDSKALDYYEQALVIKRDIADRQGEGAVINNIGTMYAKQEQYLEAFKYFQQALVIHREVGDKRGEAGDNVNLGGIYANLGQSKKALSFFGQAVKILKELGALDDLWQAQAGLALVEANLEQFQKAIKHYEQALDTIESIRADLSDKKHQLSFNRNKLEVYNNLLNLLQTLHYDKKALEIFERKQSRIFLAEIGKSGARRFAKVHDKITRQEQALIKKLSETQTRLLQERSKPFEEQNSTFVKTLTKNLVELENKEQKQQIKLKNDYPDYYALKYPKSVDLDTIQKKVLKSKELILVYGVMKNNITLWVIGKETFQQFNLPISEKILTEKVKDIQLGVGWKLNTRATLDPEPGDLLSEKKLSNLTYELYNLLFPYLVRPLVEKASTVYIVPTSALYALPFEMLATKPVKRKTYKIHYLIKNAPISYLSSASLLKVLRDAKKRRIKTTQDSLLAFANPVYQGNNFTQLPNTETEANEIAKFFNSSILQLGKQATVKNVLKFNKKGLLDDYQYLLFATHGVIPSEFDLLNQPALVLSHPNPYLKMADVFGLKLNAKLVSLSACNTGRGKQERGEGVMGLTRAFMYAGTPTVAMTLWAVETHSTEQLNVDFFKQLSKGKKPAKALQTVKLKMLSGDNEKYQHPYYWAPMVLFGDGS